MRKDGVRRGPDKGLMKKAGEIFKKLESVDAIMAAKAPRGWQCPVCGVVNAPTNSTCSCMPPRIQTSEPTISTGTPGRILGRIYW